MSIRLQYLGTVRDLENCLIAGDDYDIVRSSGLVRKLFLDASPIADRANRDAHVKFVFDVLLPSALPIPSVMHIKLVPGEDFPNSPSRAQIKRDHFFKLDAGHFQGNKFTVQEIVLHAAHVLGGIHFGEAKERAHKTLEDLNAAFIIGGEQASLALLRNIGRIVVRSLRPLTEILQ